MIEDILLFIYLACAFVIGGIIGLFIERSNLTFADQCKYAIAAVLLIVFYSL